MVCVASQHPKAAGRTGCAGGSSHGSDFDFCCRVYGLFCFYARRGLAEFSPDWRGVSIIWGDIRAACGTGGVDRSRRAADVRKAAEVCGESDFQAFISDSGQLREVLKVYYRHPFVLVWGLGLTIFLQSLVITAYWVIGRDLNIAAPLGYYFVIFPLVWVVGSIPVSIAGIGILEGGLVFLFVRYGGASAESAAALALCQRLTWLGASLPGLYFHLTGSHRNVSNENTAS